MSCIKCEKFEYPLFTFLLAGAGVINPALFGVDGQGEYPNGIEEEVDNVGESECDGVEV